MAWDPTTVARFREAYGAEERARRQREAEDAADVLAKLPSAAAMLRADFGVRRVGWFGSLRTGRLSTTSDVDIYVDAIRHGSYFDALDRLIAALGRPVDLVELDRAAASLRSCILEEGVDVDA